MKNDSKNDLAEQSVCACICLLCVYILLKYAVVFLLPFIIALCVGIIVYPLSVKMAKLTHLPRKLCAALLLILFILGFGYGLFFCSMMLIKEARLLLTRISDTSDPIGVNVRHILDTLESLLQKLPFVSAEESSDTIALWCSAYFKQTVSSLCTSLISSVGRIASAMPKLIISVLLTIIACFYTSFDLDKIKEFFFSLLQKGKSKAFLGRFSFALKAYAKAYLLLFVITFFELLIGLFILRRQYAFILALLIAAIDILPVFGAGVVLIPWAIFLFISKQYSLGCGILILYGTVTVIRQIAEPRLVGKELGIHPLASLFCMFAGLKLFGFVGILFAPMVAIIVKEMLK